MKRGLQVLLALIVVLVVLPPLWFAVFPADPPPELPPAGVRVELPGGNAVNVIEAGAGPPVVLAHGLPGTSYEWRETSAELSAMGRHAIAYDRVGYGRSDPRRSGAYTTESNAAELIALLEAMDLEDVTVVGWSYGGATAMTAAMRQGDSNGRIGRIVLVGTGGPDSPDSQPPSPSLFTRFFYSDPVLRWRVAIPPLGVGLMKVLSNAAYSGGPQPDWWLEGLRANFARWDTLITFREEMLGFAPVEDWDETRIQVPTLLLHGDDDNLAPVDIARYLATAIPGARLVEYPGGSHMLPVTDATDVAQRIVAFSE